MRLNSSEVISRPTQTAARAVTVFSAATMSVQLFELQPVNWPLINQPVDIETYHWITIIVLFFMSLGLAIHWSSDYQSYFKWFQSNEVSKGTLIGQTGPKSSEPIIAGLKRRIDWLENEFPRLEKAKERVERVYPADGELESSSVNIQKEIAKISTSLDAINGVHTSMNDRLSSIEAVLAELDKRFATVNFYAKVVILGWYLVLPLFLAAVAIAQTVYALIQKAAV